MWKDLINPSQAIVDIKLLMQREKNILCKDCYPKIREQGLAGRRTAYRVFLIVFIILGIMKLIEVF